MTENLITEEVLSYFNFTGHAHLYEGQSTNDYSRISPTRIVQTDQHFHVRIHWTTSGPLNNIMSGKWKGQLFMERMGGKEFTLDPQYAIKEVDFKSYPTFYNCPIDVPPGEVEEGIYHLTVALTLKGDTGSPAPVAAFADLGLVQFYKDGPVNP